MYLQINILCKLNIVLTNDNSEIHYYQSAVLFSFFEIVYFSRGYLF